MLLLLVIAAPARAGDPPGDRKTAERYFRAGEKAYAAQNFGAAAQNFEAAYKALPLPEIAFSAAQAFRRQYRVEPRLELARRAVELYRIYLDQVKTGGRVGVAADNLGEMQREVDKLLAAGAKAAAAAIAVERTRLGVSPVLGAERSGGMREIGELAAADGVKIVVTIDGKPVPPFEMVDVTPGPHAIAVQADGYIPHESVERVVKGDSAVAEIVLQPRPARVVVETEAGARIRVDGRVVGTAPVGAFELPAGKHVLTIARSGRHTVSREIAVVRGQEVTIREPLSKTPRRHAVPYVVAVAGFFAVVSVSGVVYAGIENGQAEDVLDELARGDQREDAFDRYDDHIDRRDQAMTGALVTGGVALGIGAIAAGLYWWDRPDEDAEGAIRITPIAGGGTAGLSLGGRF